jgi:hypothetical protein
MPDSANAGTLIHEVEDTYNGGKYWNMSMDTLPPFIRAPVFLLLWVLASAAGLVFGLFGGTIIGMPFSLLFDALGLGILSMVVLGAVYGAVIGLAQWLVLRHFVNWAGRWTLYSSLGGLIGFPLGFELSTAFALGFGRILHGLAMGAVIGLAQWLVLRRAGPWATVWIAASTAGMGLVWSFPIAIMAQGGMLRLAVQSLLYGGITGGCMLWLMRRVEADTPPPPPSPPKDR